MRNSGWRGARGLGRQTVEVSLLERGGRRTVSGSSEGRKFSRDFQHGAVARIEYVKLDSCINCLDVQPKKAGPDQCAHEPDRPRRNPVIQQYCSRITTSSKLRMANGSIAQRLLMGVDQWVWAALSRKGDGGRPSAAKWALGEQEAVRKHNSRPASASKNHGENDGHQDHPEPATARTDAPALRPRGAAHTRPELRRPAEKAWP